MDLFREYSANFGKSPEGNVQIIKFYKSILTRQKVMADMSRKLRKEGMRDREVESKIIEYMDTNPLSIGKKDESRTLTGSLPGGIMTREEWEKAGRPKR